MAIQLDRANAEGLSRSVSVPAYNVPYTVFMRFRLTTLPGDGRTTFWNLRNADNAEPETDIVYLENTAGNVIALRVIDHSGGFNQILAFGTTAIVAGVDYDLFIVRTSSTHMDLYLNGALEATGTAAAGPTITPGKLSFGMKTNGQDNMNGAISDLAIWTAALDATDRNTVRTTGARFVAANLWERWSGLNHLLISGDVNARALLAAGTISTVADPAIPGIAPQDTTTPVQLSLTTQPSGARSGSAIEIQPRVEVLNINGAVVTDQVIAVTAAILTGTGTLVGTATVNTVAGVATFTNLQVNGYGSHSLRFSASTLIADDSDAFVVSPSNPASIGLSPVARNARGDTLSGKTFTFVSSSPGVATVDSTGFVRAVAAGSTNITGTSEGVDSPVTVVTVTAPS